MGKGKSAEGGGRGGTLSLCTGQLGRWAAKEKGVQLGYCKPHILVHYHFVLFFLLLFAISAAHTYPVGTRVRVVYT